jgi:DNA-binding transcriptional MerR regulator
MKTYTRKALAEELGVGIETLRFYEKLKLIRPPERNSSGYRIYTPEDADKLRHLLVAKEYGFTLKEIKMAFEAAEGPEPSAERVRPILGKKLEEIDARIRGLEKARSLILDFLRTPR